VTESVKALALKVARSAISSHNQGFLSGRSFTEPKTRQELISLLGNADSTVRQAAVDSLSQDYWKDHLDQVFGIMTGDSDLNVRTSAFAQFKQVTGYKGDNLDNFSAQNWWALHRKDHVK
jgi:HEAT repeat protein